VKSRSKGRQANEVYRVREHLTEAEIDKLLAALKRKILVRALDLSVLCFHINSPSPSMRRLPSLRA
jgi:hypothetical protein